MNKFFLTLTSSLVFAFTYAQTNVSGGIFSNTTWTLVNSPYIVVDTVVVFPGVTLTIQPGVTVKFANSKRLEIRNASLIAIGTLTDSITFTSNDSTPVAGIWGDIYLNGSTGNGTVTFKYCNIRYANYGIKSSYYTVTIKNSRLENNSTGMDYSFNLTLSLQMDSCDIINNSIGISSYNGLMYINRSNFNTGVKGINSVGQDLYLTNCNFYNYSVDGVYTYGGGISMIGCTASINQNGIYCRNPGLFIINNNTVDSNSVEGIHLELTNGGSIQNSRMRYNGIGFHSMWSVTPCSVTHNVIDNNNIGIKVDVSNGQDYFSCNHICNNTSFGFYNNTSSNVNVPNNFWCKSDSISTQLLIYDAHNNISMGIVYFLPLDTNCAPDVPTSINEIAETNSFSIFPNPTVNTFTIKNNSSSENSSVQIINPFGEIVYAEKLLGKNEYVVDRNFTKGIYFVRVKDVVRKLVVE